MKRHQDELTEFDAICELLKEYKLPLFITNDFWVMPNEPKYSAVQNALCAFFRMLRENNDEDGLKVCAKQDELTHTSLVVTISGAYISLKSGKEFAELLRQADSFDVETSINGNCVIALTFEGVYNIMPKGAIVKIRRHSI